MQDGRLLAVVLIDVGITGRLKPLRNALRLHLALGRFLAIGYEYDAPVGQIGRLRIVALEGRIAGNTTGRRLGHGVVFPDRPIRVVRPAHGEDNFCSIEGNGRVVDVALPVCVGTGEVRFATARRGFIAQIEIAALTRDNGVGGISQRGDGALDVSNGNVARHGDGIGTAASGTGGRSGDYTHHHPQKGFPHDLVAHYPPPYASVFPCVRCDDSRHNPAV